MKQLKLPLLIFSVLALAGVFIFLIRANYLPNPLENVSPENEILANIFGTVNDFLSPAEETEEKSLEEQFADSGYPAELFSFDVTSQPAAFAIVNVNPSDKTMVLQYILPFDRQGQVIKSVINCSTKGSVVMILDPNSDTTETTIANKPIYELANENVDTLQGICGDRECHSIVGDCELLKPK